MRDVRDVEVLESVRRLEKEKSFRMLLLLRWVLLFLAEAGIEGT